MVIGEHNSLTLQRLFSYDIKSFKLTKTKDLLAFKYFL